ncbi:hypothetical protein J8L70_13770 [Pseudoalteromonas sp. MMG010]|uniref:hypothetical protein n=1 Tax=Pseudoalteromonas sp. MMG010 TaxID=2822685 RepID=UPI001B39DFAB|nr:hypothetical protein [Pseudoalteromonas sp. MMG010]MBQ4834316.1 hypothetical protein [Pseudoalteromonas sp. MMG010]
MQKKIFKNARKIHKWLGYILAIQILVWLLGGLVMSAIPLEKVHGKHLAKRSINNPFSHADYVASLDDIVTQVVNPTQILYSHFLNTPTITVISKTGTHIFNALTAQPFKAPSKSQVIANAKAHLLINASLSQATLLQQAPREAGYKKNIWQLQYNDILNTTLYLAKDSGKVMAIRSDLWRIFDFFWMLHIMDYDDRENFNNPLLISFAASSVLFCLTGMLLLLQTLRRRQFVFFKRK